MAIHSFTLAGARHRPSLAQQRCLQLVDGEALTVVPEPTNRFDKNALQIHTTDGIFIGYVPKSEAAELALEGTILHCSCLTANDLFPRILLETYEPSVEEA